ncbi:MAG: ATPase, T2SS/T4P/T4SS family [Promethearchaeota archaeon]
MIKNKHFKSILIENENIIIEYEKLLPLIEYFRKVKKIKKLYQTIKNVRLQKCNYHNFKCKIFDDFSSFSSIDTKVFLNPIEFFHIFNKKLRIINNKKSIDLECRKCYYIIKSSFEKIQRILKSTTFIDKLEELQNKFGIKNYPFQFYENILFNRNPLINELEKAPKILENKNEKVLQQYYIGDLNVFQVCIKKIFDEAQKKYLVNIFFKNTLKETYYNRIIEYVLKNINSTIRFEKIVPIEGLIKVYSKEIEHYLNLKFNLSKKENKRLSFIITLKKLNLIKLFPFLIDDYVEEIFLDSPKDKVYLNHQKYGRCKTSISFNNKEIERLKTLIRLYSGQRLDFSNPSIKHVIKNKYFYCRFAIDVEPINLNEFSLDIRKLNKNILTIQDLLKNKTIYPLMAAFLYFNILRRVNITVTGETDSGKTTFINALDLLVPKEFRKIYIENVIESLNELEYDKHQLKFKVNSLEELENIKYSKSNQIKKLLHRTPDIIYLGEILTKEEAEAMFHCLAAGLRGFQTIHANNIESLLNRFLYHFKINESCLTDLDLIVLMKKNNNKRRVFSISEICIEKSQNGYNQIIFQYNPESKRWDINTSLYKTKTIENLKKFEKLSKEKFFAYINIYNDIFEYISKINNLDNIILVDFFHKVSYYSLKSLKKLSNFWNNIRKNSTLNL